MDNNQFSVQIKRLEKAFRKPYPEEAVATMYQRLKGWHVKALSAAVEEILIEERFLPSFSKIIAVMKTVASARQWEAPEGPQRAPVYACRVCEDTGIKLRRHRADIVTDFYCTCAAAAEKTKHDWSESPWRESIVRPARWVKRVAYELKTERPDAAAMVAQIFDEEPPF